jgi:hypothetical protein
MTPRPRAALALVLAWAGATPAHASPPARLKDRVWADSDAVAGPGRIIEVPGGGDLAAALRDAQLGDVIVLEPQAVYHGPFRLPRKPGEPGSNAGRGWIVVRSGSLNLPLPGTRTDPSEAPEMAILESASAPVITALRGAHHFRFIGLEMRPARGAYLENLVVLGESNWPAADLPHHFSFERCFLHGDPEMGARRGIAMNSAHTSVADSHLSDFKAVGVDAQAIAGWSGPGPFRIVNNYLEASGENVMFGGADAPDASRIPSDIDIRRNHFNKPPKWKEAAEAMPWTVKNLLELKSARRVSIDGNLFEHNWVAAQNGFAILFTVRNQDGKAPWTVVEDVTFANNIVRHAGAGINLLGRDDSRPVPSGQTRRVLVRNNLFTDLGSAQWGGAGTLFQVLQGVPDLTIEHNTGLQSGPVLMAEGARSPGFVFRRNVVLHQKAGISGTGTGPGNDTLAAYFPGASVEGNVFVGGDAARYPAGNFFPASPEEWTSLYGALQPDATAPQRAAPGASGLEAGVDMQGLADASAAAGK